MGRELPILFNTDMVRAILDGRKTVTRRVIKTPPHQDMPENHNYCRMPLWMRIGKNEYDFRTLHYMDVVEQSPFKQIRYFESLAPFDKGDILYVRETWAFLPCTDCVNEEVGCCDESAVVFVDKNRESKGCFTYRADCPLPDRMKWTPSIHMPKRAARIWLKVTDVRVERLQEISNFMAEGIALSEGCEECLAVCGKCNRDETPIGCDNEIELFADLWDSTVKKSAIDCYGWEANPWVWVIEFERCEKPGSEV